MPLVNTIKEYFHDKRKLPFLSFLQGVVGFFFNSMENSINIKIVLKTQTSFSAVLERNLKHEAEWEHRMCPSINLLFSAKILI